MEHDSHGSVVFRIARQDSPNTGRYWQSFAVSRVPGMNVISALQAIAAQPNPLGGHGTATPVAWDCNCLEEVCGACTMVINGRVRQACSAIVDKLDRTDAGEIELEPMSKFPVIRDLVVDRSRMFRALRRVKGWIPVDGYYDAGPGPIQSPGNQDEAYPLSQCMTCGCCLEACPQYSKVDVPQDPGEGAPDYLVRKNERYDKAFLGAAAISKAILFDAHPTGSMNRSEQIEAMMGPGGITDCATL